MKLMQVFDCQDMPDNVRKEFYESYEQGNDVYVSWHRDYMENEVVEQWLVENGATDRQVLINHWW